MAEPASDQNVEGKPADQPANRSVRVEIDDKDAICTYANFCRVTGTPEELILDFGLNSQPYGMPTEPVQVKQRIVTNYYTAKRMLQALGMSVQNHERVFGVLETDIQKRATGVARRAQAAAGSLADPAS